jgi:hypothetical protein
MCHVNTGGKFEVRGEQCRYHAYILVMVKKAGEQNPILERRMMVQGLKEHEPRAKSPGVAGETRV